MILLPMILRSSVVAALVRVRYTATPATHSTAQPSAARTYAAIRLNYYLQEGREYFREGFQCLEN